MPGGWWANCNRETPSSNARRNDWQLKIVE